MKPISVWIVWGLRGSEQEPQEYQFNTQEEKEAFLYGVEECDGWLEHRIFDSFGEAMQDKEENS